MSALLRNTQESMQRAEHVRGRRGPAHTAGVSPAAAASATRGTLARPTPAVRPREAPRGPDTALAPPCWAPRAPLGPAASSKRPALLVDEPEDFPVVSLKPPAGHGAPADAGRGEPCPWGRSCGVTRSAGHSPPTNHARRHQGPLTVRSRPTSPAARPARTGRQSSVRS